MKFNHVISQVDIGLVYVKTYTEKEQETLWTLRQLHLVVMYDIYPHVIDGVFSFLYSLAVVFLAVQLTTTSQSYVTTANT